MITYLFLVTISDVLCGTSVYQRKGFNIKTGSVLFRTLYSCISSRLQNHLITVLWICHQSASGSSHTVRMLFFVHCASHFYRLFGCCKCPSFTAIHREEQQRFISTLCVIYTAEKTLYNDIIVENVLEALIRVCCCG